MWTKRKNGSNIVGIDEDEYQRLVNFFTDHRYRKRSISKLLRSGVRTIDEPPAEGQGPFYKLDMPSSKAKSLAPSIGQLQSLKELDLHNSKNLSSLPEEIGNLVNLQSLNLSGSAITLLPSSIGQLQSLKELNLHNTKNLTSLPGEIGNLANLQSLDLSVSGITALPSSIGQLQSLKDLDLGYTYRLTSLPEEIGNLANLQALNLYLSPIASLPSSIGQLQSLTRLNLGSTSNLTSLPEEIGNLANLKLLYLHEAEITSLPQSIERLQSLEKLDIRRSGLTSYGPIGKLKGLKWIHLSGSRIHELRSSCDDVFFKFVLKLTQLHPYLGTLNYADLRSIYCERKIEYALACNRFRFRKGKARPSDCFVWWPHLLNNSKRLFSEYEWTSESCSLEDYQRIYLLLLLERDSFINTILFARQSDHKDS